MRENCFSSDRKVTSFGWRGTIIGNTDHRRQRIWHVDTFNVVLKPGDTSILRLASWFAEVEWVGLSRFSIVKWCWPWSPYWWPGTIWVSAKMWEMLVVTIKSDEEQTNFHLLYRGCGKRVNYAIRRGHTGIRDWWIDFHFGEMGCGIFLNFCVTCPRHIGIGYWSEMFHFVEKVWKPSLNSCVIRRWHTWLRHWRKMMLRDSRFSWVASVWRNSFAIWNATQCQNRRIAIHLNREGQITFTDISNPPSHQTPEYHWQKPAAHD